MKLKIIIPILVFLLAVAFVSAADYEIYNISDDINTFSNIVALSNGDTIIKATPAGFDTDLYYCQDSDFNSCVKRDNVFNISFWSLEKGMIELSTGGIAIALQDISTVYLYVGFCNATAQNCYYTNVLQNYTDYSMIVELSDGSLAIGHTEETESLSLVTICNASAQNCTTFVAYNESFAPDVFEMEDGSIGVAHDDCSGAGNNMLSICNRTTQVCYDKIITNNSVTCGWRTQAIVKPDNSLAFFTADGGDDSVYWVSCDSNAENCVTNNVTPAASVQNQPRAIGLANGDLAALWVHDNTANILVCDENGANCENSVPATGGIPRDPTDLAQLQSGLIALPYSLSTGVTKVAVEIIPPQPPIPVNYTVAAEDWPMMFHDHANNEYSSNIAPNDIFGEVYNYSATGTPSQPIIYGDYVYVPTSSGIYQLNKNTGQVYESFI